MTPAMRARLVLGGVLGVSIPLGVSGILIHLVMRTSLSAEFDRALEAKATALAELVEVDNDVVVAEIDPAGAPGDRDYFEIRANGRLLIRSNSLGNRELVPSNGLASTVLPDGRAGRQVTMRFLPRREPGQAATAPLPEAVLVLARGTEAVEQTIGLVGTLLFGIGTFATMLALAMLALATRIGRGSSRERTAELGHALAGILTTVDRALDRDQPAERYRAALAEVRAIAQDTERIVEAIALGRDQRPNTDISPLFRS